MKKQRVIVLYSRTNGHLKLVDSCFLLSIQELETK